MLTIQQLIDRYGGLARLARAINEFAHGDEGARDRRCYPTMVFQWRKSGAIPGRWLRTIVRMAEADGWQLSRDEILSLLSPDDAEGPDQIARHGPSFRQENLN